MKEATEEIARNQPLLRTDFEEDSPLRVKLPHSFLKDL
jgi:hypothetical protein